MEKDMVLTLLTQEGSQFHELFTIQLKQDPEKVKKLLTKLAKKVTPPKKKK